MKLIPSTVIVAGMAALLLVAGCGKSLQQRLEQAKSETPEEQQTPGKIDEAGQLEYLDEWQAFRTEAEKQIAANVKSLDDLKSKAAATDEKLRGKLNASVDDLAQKNTELKAKLDNYKDDGKLNWDVFKRDFSHDLDGLDKALKNLDSGAQK